VNQLVRLRLLAVLAPIVCLALGVWLVWSQRQRSVTLEQDLARVRKNVEFQKSMIAEIGSQPLAAKEPSLTMSDAEQATFLEGLRKIAGDSGVVLTKWTNVAAPAPDPNSKAEPLPDGVLPVLSNLEVNGPYASIRSFLYEIGRAPRLLNFSAVKWRRKDTDDTTTLSLTITRYVSPPDPASPVPTSAVSTDSKESS
jgi:Tfp pilus assembly protein PilO